jgi:hypothetical protein
VPTDPYVPVPLDEKPRQQQNFAPGVHMPAARPWAADRPGDATRDPRGGLVGSPGPNVGFALTLAHRAQDRMRLEPHARVRHAEHSYVTRRAVADSVSAAILRRPRAEVLDHVGELRAAIAAGVVAGVAPE